MNYANFIHTLDSIKQAGIAGITTRAQDLASLLADYVDYETDAGQLVTNKSLESQAWWAVSQAFIVRDLGFTRLGNGHFSAAYSHPMLPGKVIKVGFKKEDSGAAYVAFCRLNAGKAGIPTIHHVKRHSACYTVVMDHLKPICNAHGSTLYDVESGEDGDQIDQIRYAVTKGRIMPIDEWHTEAHKELIRRFAGSEMAKTCLDIHKFFEGIARFDMHSGNMMVDDKGHIIITDPVSFSSKGRETDMSMLLEDPDALIAEVEAAARELMVNRCWERKNKRDPKGAFQEMRRRHCKARRNNHKRALRALKEINTREVQSLPYFAPIKRRGGAGAT